MDQPPDLARKYDKRMGLEDLNIKPVVVLKTGEVSKEDIEQLRDNNLCVIESE